MKRVFVKCPVYSKALPSWFKDRNIKKVVITKTFDGVLETLQTFDINNFK